MNMRTRIGRAAISEGRPEIFLILALILMLFPSWSCSSHSASSDEDAGAESAISTDDPMEAESNINIRTGTESQAKPIPTKIVIRTTRLRPTPRSLLTPKSVLMVTALSKTRRAQIRMPMMSVYRKVIRTEMGLGTVPLRAKRTEISTTRPLWPCRRAPRASA